MGVDLCVLVIQVNTRLGDWTRLGVRATLGDRTTVTRARNSIAVMVRV